jgi:hypothetical protein
MDGLAEALAHILKAGSPSQAMREDEVAMGFEPIYPGERPWLPAEDWSPRDVVSIRSTTIRIVAILAKRPGTGAFSRLITAIAKAGMTPIVVEPMFDMPNILKRWGWTSQIIGAGSQRQEIWSPSAAWLEKRAHTSAMQGKT